MFVHIQYMIADLGTQPFNNLELVNQDSTWINEFSWMKKEKRCFSAKAIDGIRLDKKETVARQKEDLRKYSSERHDDEYDNTYLGKQVDNGLSFYKNVPQEVEELYKFSNYLKDLKKRSLKQLWELFHLCWNLWKT